MALEDGVGTWLAPYDQVSYLRPQANDHSLDVPLFNVGVLVIPARSVTADAYAAVTTGAVQHGRGTGRTSDRLAHATFNHRSIARWMCCAEDAEVHQRPRVLEYGAGAG
jgi:hypothetical protein